jgi:hypothetical protein
MHLKPNMKHSFVSNPPFQSQGLGTDQTTLASGVQPQMQSTAHLRQTPAVHAMPSVALLTGNSPFGFGGRYSDVICLQYLLICVFHTS